MKSVIPVKPVTVREGRGDTSALSKQSLDLPGNWDKVSVARDTSRFLLPAGTSFVERDVLNVAEEVHRVSEGKLSVASCSCGRCVEKGHFPHVVLELDRRGRTSPVFGFTTFGPEVVQRVREIHISQKHVQKASARNKLIREQAKKNASLAQQEKLEIIEAALKSSKFDWRGPEGLRTRA